MDRPKIRGPRGPESIIQDAIMQMLRDKGWFVRATVGSTYMTGFPDLYACRREARGLIDPNKLHLEGIQRWIEVKNPKSYKFTPAQVEVFPQISAQGVGIWVMTEATEHEYQKLWQPPNWHMWYARQIMFRT